MNEEVILQAAAVAACVHQIVTLHNQGAILTILVTWRMKGRESLLPGDVQDWSGVVHRTEGTKLYVEFVETPGQCAEIPQQDVDYIRISCKMQAVMPTMMIQEEAVSSKRPRDEYDSVRNFMVEAADFANLQSFVRVGSSTTGFRIPTTTSRFAPFYPSLYVCKMVAGSPKSVVFGEWRSDLQEWMGTRDVIPRVYVAKCEMELARTLFDDWLTMTDILLSTKKYCFDDLPDQHWKAAHHIVELVLKICVFASKGQDGLEVMRTKLDTMWSKSKVDYSVVVEAVTAIKRHGQTFPNGPSQFVSQQQHHQPTAQPTRGGQQQPHQFQRKQTYSFRGS